MSHLIKISEAASMALHSMVLMAARGGRPASTRDLASVMGGSEAHLSKVLQRLAKAGLVVSGRGPRGGFCLARDPGKITLREVYESMEGPLEEARCLLEKPICGGNCILGGLLSEVDRKAGEYMSQKTLADFVAAFEGGKNGPAQDR